MKIDRKKVYKKYNDVCGYCGEHISYDKFQIDHIIPKKDFIYCVNNKIHVPYFLTHLTVKDMNHIDNLMPSCISCNKYKSAMTLDEWKYFIKKLVITLNNNSQYKFAKRFGLVQETFIDFKFYFEKFL